MLDTVILTMPKGSYSIAKPEMFSPNATILDVTNNPLIRCFNNSSAADKRKNIYRPRLTLMKRMTKNGIDMPLKIEFSVAKMLHGNNVDEVVETDFEKVVDALRKSLYDMGVIVFSKPLSEAPISAFHPSKNIELMGGYTANFVITELHKIDVSKKMDLNRDSFRNDGHSLQFYTNSHSLVVYDKVQDLKKPEKRATDKDQNSIQLSLFDVLKTKRKEIVRIEARLAKKVKMNALLQKLGLKENPTFEEVFKRSVCQKVLLFYWRELITSKNLFLFDVESNPKKTLETVFRHQPSIRPKEAIYLVGLRTLSREGIRGTRVVIEQHATPRTWYRIAKDLPILDDISGKTYHAWVKQVDNSLRTFEPFNLSTPRQVAM